MPPIGYKGPSFPFRFNGAGRIASTGVDLDDPAHILESVRQIVGTRQGERVMRPEFGADADDLVFSPQNNSGIRIAVHNIGRQVLRWEKRVDLQKVEIEKLEGLEAHINLDIRIKVTRQTESLSVPVSKEAP